eukprot:jgi/Undpi1/11508/HiC_scaffold_30.g13805.m1
MAVMQVRGAFEKLYSFLAGELETAAQLGDTPLQFALMDAWGVEVHEADHDLLARVRIFNILQEILDTTIKHSPGAIREAVEPRPVKTSAAAAVATAGALALSSQSSVDAAARQQHSDMAAEGEPSDDLDAPRDPEAEDDSDGDQVAIEAAAAAAAATAAAAEELAAAESHSLTQGAMKLVYLLAIQVATSGPESGNSGSGIAASESSATVSRAPKLVRARSGPATLSHAVFEMLYVELRSNTQGKEGQEERAEETVAPQENTDAAEVLDAEPDAAAVAVPDVAAAHASETTDGGGGGDGSAGVGGERTDEVEEGEEEDARVLEQLADMRDDMACLTLSRELQVLVSEVTMLLLCVSSTDACRSLLSQPRWIAVLLGLLRLGPPYAQRRALRLLRRLLPHCDPESLAAKDGGSHCGDGVDWSIVSIVKESGAGAAGLGSDDEREDREDSEQGSEASTVETAGEAPGAGGGGNGRTQGRGVGGAVPMVRVTSLSSSVHADLIPARSLLCFFLDAIGGSYQTTPHPEWLGDVEADANQGAGGGGGGGTGGGGGGDGRANGGTLRELRSWYRGQATSSSGREHGRSAWAFSQLEGPLVCESVSLLRTLLHTLAWGGVTATLLQDAVQRGNSCLRLLAREAAEKVEAAASAVPPTPTISAGASANTGAAAATAPSAPAGTNAEVDKAIGAGAGALGERYTASVAGVPGSGAVAGAVAASMGPDSGPQPTPSEASAAGNSGGGARSGTTMESRAVPPAISTGASAGPSLPSSPAARGQLAGMSPPPSTTGTLLRTLGALSVLGGHVDVLYPGASAEIMPLDYGMAYRGGGGAAAAGTRGSRSSQASSGWGARVGRSVFGLSGLERATSAAVGGGDAWGRGGGGGGRTAPVGASPTAVGAAGGGRPCVIVSLSLAEGQAEAVPNVPVRPGTLPPGLAQRILETLTLWCLDKGLNAAFSDPLSPTIAPFAPLPVGTRSSLSPGGDRGRGGDREGLAGVLSTAVLDRHLLLGLVRCQAAKAAQTLLLHPQTASDFVKSAAAAAPGRKTKGGAGAVLLEVASCASSSAGLGDIGAMEELTALLLAHWQFSVLDGRSKRVQEARWVGVGGGEDAGASAGGRNRARQRADAAKQAVIAAAEAQARASAREKHPDAEERGQGDAASSGMSGAGSGAAAATAGDLHRHRDGDDNEDGDDDGANDDVEEEQQEGEDEINPLTAHMAEMGFPIHWCERALAETGDDIEAALNWILSNGELLSVEDSLRESIQSQSQAAAAQITASELAREEEAAAAVAVVVAAEADVAAAVAEAGGSSGGGGGAGGGTGEGAQEEASGVGGDTEGGVGVVEEQGEGDQGQGPRQPGQSAEQESLLTLDRVGREAVSGEVAVPSFNQGMEPGWPRIFHCGLSEEVELPLLAEPRLSAEQVGGLYAGEEVTAVGQHGDWLHVRLYEFDDDEEEDEDKHDHYPRGSSSRGRASSGRSGSGSGRNPRPLEGDSYLCERCGTEHLQEPLVWALRRTAQREFLRLGPCPDSPRVGWDGLDIERLPPPVDQAGPRPGQGQRGAGGGGGGGVSGGLQPLPSYEESKEALAATAAAANSGAASSSAAGSAMEGEAAGAPSTVARISVNAVAPPSITAMFRIARQNRARGNTGGSGGSDASLDSAGSVSVYRVVAVGGIRVRRFANPLSAEVTVLQEGTELVVSEELQDGNGGVWMRLTVPVEGWIGRPGNSLVRLSRGLASGPLPGGGGGGGGGGAGVGRGSAGQDRDGSSETGEAAESALAKELEDCMEEEAGTELYRRDDRLFGSRQGWSLPSGGGSGVGMVSGGGGNGGGGSGSHRDASHRADSRVPGERRAIVVGHASVSGCWAAVAGMSASAVKEKLARTADTLAVLHCRKILLTVLLQCHREVTRGAAAAGDGQAVADATLSQRVAALVGARDSPSTPSGSRGGGAVSKGGGDVVAPARASPVALRTRAASRQFSSFLQLVLFRAWRPGWWPLSDGSAWDEGGEAESGGCDGWSGGVIDAVGDEEDERTCLDDREPLPECFRSLPVVLTPLVLSLLRAAAAQRALAASSVPESAGASKSWVGTASSGGVDHRGLSPPPRSQSFGAHVKEAMLQSVASQLRQATRIGHGEHAWADSDTAEMSDAHCLRYPRLRYVTWAARIVQAGSGSPTVPRRIFHAWVTGLRSPSLPVKQQVCAELSQLLDEAVRGVDRACLAAAAAAAPASGGDGAAAAAATDGDAGVTSSSGADSTAASLRRTAAAAVRRLSQCINLLPLERLRSLAERRMLKEGEDEPMLSRALQSIVDLVASAELASRVLHERQAMDAQPAAEGRSVLCFPSPSAYVALQGRDLEAPWTAEFWLLKPNRDGTWEDGENTESASGEGRYGKGGGGDEGENGKDRSSPILELEAAPSPRVPRRGIRKSYSERLPAPRPAAAPLLMARASSTPMSSVDLSQLPPADPNDGAPSLFRARSVDAVGQNDPDDEAMGGGLNPCEFLPPHSTASARGRIARGAGVGEVADPAHAEDVGGEIRGFSAAFAPTAPPAAPSAGQKSGQCPWNMQTSIRGGGGGTSGGDGDGEVAAAAGRNGAGRGRLGGASARVADALADFAESEAELTRKGEAGVEPPEYLASSQSGYIRIQAGGAMSRPLEGGLEADSEDSKEGEEEKEPVDDGGRAVQEEAFCLSMGANGEKGRAFDYVVPTGRWVHVALVAPLSAESEITLYADGVAVDTINLRLPLPMGCLGAGPHAQEVSAAANGGGSFVGLLAQTRYWRQARTAGEIARDMRRNVSGMDGLVGLWGCDEGQGSALTDWTDNHACCLGRGGTEWVHVPRGVPVAPVRGHGRWELLAAVGLRPDFESDDQRLPEGEEEEGKDGETAGADDQVMVFEGQGEGEGGGEGGEFRGGRIRIVFILRHFVFL